ncbi:MAG: hypothetical protein FJ025_02015 [Chloroflexi bacterium]|nr:hypothetical protein [Chloroflexota bacterium]
MIRKQLKLILLLILVLTITGCAQVEDLDTASYKVVNTNDLLRSPDSYKGKKIAISGKVTNACAGDGCYFDLNDGRGTINIDLKQIAIKVFPNKNGAPVRVYGEFISIGSKPYISAHKIVFQ